MSQLNNVSSTNLHSGEWTYKDIWTAYDVHILYCMLMFVCVYLYLYIPVYPYELYKSALSYLYCRSLYSKCRGKKCVFLTHCILTLWLEFWESSEQDCAPVLPLGEWYQLVSCLVCWLFNKCQQLTWSTAIVLLLVVFPYIPQEHVNVYWCVYNEENIFRMNLSEVFPS